MRKLGIIAVLALMVTALAAVPALAASPHFLRQSATINDSGALVVTFKEAGLGNALESANYTLNATGTATYACVNRGEKHPQAANKESFEQQLTDEGTFPVRNGSVTGSLSVGPVPSTLDCPGGQREVLVSVSYT